MTRFIVAIGLLIGLSGLVEAAKPFAVKKRGVSFPQRDPTQAAYEFVGLGVLKSGNLFRVRFELKDDIFSNFVLTASGSAGASPSRVTIHPDPLTI